jgi:hypothetical protein
MHEGRELATDTLLVIGAEAAQVKESVNPYDSQAGPIGEDERAVRLDDEAARTGG